MAKVEIIYTPAFQKAYPKLKGSPARVTMILIFPIRREINQEIEFENGLPEDPEKLKNRCLKRAVKGTKTLKLTGIYQLIQNPVT